MRDSKLLNKGPTKLGKTSPISEQEPPEKVDSKKTVKVTPDSDKSRGSSDSTAHTTNADSRPLNRRSAVSNSDDSASQPPPGHQPETTHQVIGPPKEKPIRSAVAKPTHELDSPHCEKHPLVPPTEPISQVQTVSQDKTVINDPSQPSSEGITSPPTQSLRKREGTETGSDAVPAKSARKSSGKLKNKSGLANMVMDLKTKAEDEQLQNDPDFASWLPPKGKYYT